MKITSSRADDFCAHPDPAVCTVLVYGPDEGVARERASALAVSACADLSDPFRVVNMDGTALVKDPARLADEVAAMALTGGRRVIRVAIGDSGDAVSKTFADVIANRVGDALIVVHAGDLSPRSRLRQLFEKDAAAAAVPCYHDEGRSFQNLARAHLAAQDVAISAEALEHLLLYLGADRAVTRGELDKLALYKGAAGEVTVDDVVACLGMSSVLDRDDLARALADGDIAAAHGACQRLMGEGHNAVALLRAVAWYFMRLHLVAAAVPSQGLEQAMGLLKPPIFWKLRAQFSAQARRWRVRAIARAIDVLLRAEIDCKSAIAPEEAILGRAFLYVAQAGRQR